MSAMTVTVRGVKYSLVRKKATKKRRKPKRRAMCRSASGRFTKKTSAGKCRRGSRRTYVPVKHRKKAAVAHRSTGVKAAKKRIRSHVSAISKALKHFR